MWDEHCSAGIGNDIVVFTDVDAGHFYGHGRVDLNDSIAGTDHGDPASVNRVANRFATIDVSTETIDHSAAYFLAGRRVG
ncbi:hypothetical protein D3C75_1334370 [compost metagenome]